MVFVPSARSRCGWPQRSRGATSLLLGFAGAGAVAVIRFSIHLLEVTREQALTPYSFALAPMSLQQLPTRRRGPLTQHRAVDNRRGGTTAKPQRWQLQRWQQKRTLKQKNREEVRQVQHRPVTWPPKAGRSSHGGSALQVHACLSGVVENITADGAYVRLYWEFCGSAIPTSDNWHKEPQPSPIVGFVDADALRSAFRHIPEGGPLEPWRYLYEGQLVNVQVRDLDNTYSLALELTSNQPVAHIEQPQAFTSQVSMEQLSKFLRAERLYADGLANLTAAASPAMGWQDEAWAPWLHDLPQEEPLAPVVAAAWSVADSGRDVAVSGPMSPQQRAHFYMVPLLRRLQGQRKTAGTGPTAIIVGGEQVRRVMGEALLAYNIAFGIVDSANVDAQQLHHCSVILAGPQDLFRNLNKAGGTAATWQHRPRSTWQRILAHISFVAVDDLGFWASVAPRSLEAILKVLPAHKWGPSYCWLPCWNTSHAPAVAAFMDTPVVVRAADSVWGARVVNEVLNTTDVVSRLAFYMHRYARLRVLAFIEDRDATAEVLRRFDTNGDLAAALLNKELLGTRTTMFADNSEPWSHGYGVFDVIIHAAPPPSAEEYRRRLASCRQLSVTLLGVDAESDKFHESWVPFIAARIETGSSEERSELVMVRRRMRKGKPMLKRALAELPLLHDLGNATLPVDAIGWNGEVAGARFQDDFSRGENGELVWTAGEESLNEELTEFSELI